MTRVTSIAIAFLIFLGAAAPAVAQQADDRTRTDSLVQQAMRSYEQGI